MSASPKPSVPLVCVPSSGSPPSSENGDPDGETLSGNRTEGERSSTGNSGRSSSLAVRRVDTLTVEEHAALKVYGYMDDDLVISEQDMLDIVDRAQRIRDATVHSLARMKTFPDAQPGPSETVWLKALKLLVMSWRNQGHSQEDARALVNGTSSHLPQAKRENGEEATLGDLQESQRVLLQLIDIWDGLVLSVLPDSLITSA